MQAILFCGGKNMQEVLYADQEILVALKPAGVESQTARRFEPDMVSRLKTYLVMNKLCTPGREPYIGVIHRLDKPVSGIMVYARTKNAAARLSSQLQSGKIRKTYLAVVCGKPVDNVDNFVDYLKKSVDGNYSQVVDKGVKDARRAELSYRVLDTCRVDEQVLSLLEIHLKTGRHHQIRVQLSSRGFPIYGDARYGNTGENREERRNGFTPLALCASGLSFVHPATGRPMEFSITPSGGIFEKFFRRE